MQNNRFRIAECLEEGMEDAEPGKIPVHLDQTPPYVPVDGREVKSEGLRQEPGQTLFRFRRASGSYRQQKGRNQPNTCRMKHRLLFHFEGIDQLLELSRGQQIHQLL